MGYMYILALELFTASMLETAHAEYIIAREEFRALTKEMCSA